MIYFYFSFFGTYEKKIKYTNTMFSDLLTQLKSKDTDLSQYSDSNIILNNKTNSNFLYIEIGNDLNPYWGFIILSFLTTSITIFINWFIIGKKIKILSAIQKYI